MPAHRRVLIVTIAVIAGYSAGAGVRWLALAPAKASPPGRTASITRGEHPWQGATALPAARPARPVGGPLPIAFPDLLAGEPQLQAGIGAVLTGRPVRAGERLPLSPYTAWIRRERALPTSAGAEVSLWTGGSQDAPAPEKDAPPAFRLPARRSPNPTRSWFLTTAGSERMSVLTLHDSSPFFTRPDLACSDSTSVPTIREVRRSPSTLWIEIDEIWTCERARRAGRARPVQPPIEVDGPFGFDRRLGFVVVVEQDGTLRRLAAAIPLLEAREDGATGELEATIAEDGLLTLEQGSMAPSETQEPWIGEYELDLALQQAIAAPTWVDEPMPGGPVSANCAPRAGAGRLRIEVDPPVTARPWALNPEVTVLAVPPDAERVRVRALAQLAGGTILDVTDDPCLRLQLTGSGLRPMPTRSLFEVVGGAERIESASLVALYRGQRALLRFEEAPPLPPELPPDAAEVIAGAVPGLRLPDAEVAAGWDLRATGPGLVTGDLDWDGREDLAALVLDAGRWEIVVLTQTARGGYRLAFHAGAPRAVPSPGDPVEQLALRRTAAGDLSLRRLQGPRSGEEWIVHRGARGFARTVLPLLRPDLPLSADRFGIAPHGVTLDPRAAGREALLESVLAGDAETFAGLEGLTPAQRATAAGWITGALGEARGDRSRLLVALALLGRPAADVATPAIGALVFGAGESWRSDAEPYAAEAALARMGEPALQLLALHPEAPRAPYAAAEIIRREPWLRPLYQQALRDSPESVAAALADAPIASPDELGEALALLPRGRPHVLHRLRALARATPRAPETDALLAAALPVLIEELSSAGAPEDAAQVAALLGDLGPVAEPAVPALQTALWSHACGVRAAARRALATLRGQAPAGADAARDLLVECPAALPPRPADPPPAGPARVPGDAFLVRLLDRVEGRGHGFVAPVDVDWRQLAQGSVPGLDVDTGRGPVVTQVRLEAARAEFATHCLPFQAPLPGALRAAHYYAITAAGVKALAPRSVLGEVCVGSSGVPRYRGHVAAQTGDSGFVLVSGAPLGISESGREALAALWPAVSAACEIDPSARPRGVAFQLVRAGKVTQYVYAVLPAGDVCADRRRLLRIEGGAAEVVEATDSGCAL